MKYPELKLDDLEQHATLGTGSFGRVRLCRHKNDGKFYALKILKKTEVLYLKQVEQQHSSPSTVPSSAARPLPVTPPSPIASVPASNPRPVALPPRPSTAALLKIGQQHPCSPSTLLPQVEHVKTEKKILEEIDHLNIVNMLGAFQDDKRAAPPPPPPPTYPCPYPMSM